jgi:hypothetical protein
MVISEVMTLFIYAVSMAFLPEYFGARRLSLICLGHSRPRNAHRPHVCAQRALRVEGRSHRRDLRAPAVGHQAHPLARRARGVEQTVVSPGYWSGNLNGCNLWTVGSFSSSFRGLCSCCLFCPLHFEIFFMPETFTRVRVDWPAREAPG